MKTICGPTYNQKYGEEWAQRVINTFSSLGCTVVRSVEVNSGESEGT